MAPLAGWRAGLVALALSTPLPVAAQLPEQVRIAWRDDSACPRPQGLEADVARLLGARSEKMSEMEVRIQVARSGRGPFALTFVVDDLTRRAERRVQLASCEEVREAAVLLIATAIDPAAALRPAPAPPSPPEQPPPPAASARPPQAAATDAPPPPRAPASAPTGPRLRRGRFAAARWSLLVGALADLQALPGPSGGPSLGASLVGRSTIVWTQARYLFPRDVDAEGDPRSKLDLFAAGVGASYGVTLGPARLGPAAELEFGLLRTQNRGERRADNAATRWGNALLGALIALWPRERVGLELGLFAGLPIWRPELLLRDGTPRHTTDAWSLRATLTLRVSLGSKD